MNHCKNCVFCKSVRYIKNGKEDLNGYLCFLYVKFYKTLFLKFTNCKDYKEYENCKNCPTVTIDVDKRDMDLSPHVLEAIYYQKMKL